MYFKLTELEPKDASFSYAIVKRPGTVFERSFATSEARRVVGRYPDPANPYTYEVLVQNDEAALMEQLRRENRANYVHPVQYAVCPANLQGLGEALSTALLGKPAWMPKGEGESVGVVDKVDVSARPRKLVAELGPFLVGEEGPRRFLDEHGIDREVIERVGTAAHLRLIPRGPLTITEFLQKIYFIAYAASRRVGLDLATDAFIDKLVRLSERWITRAGPERAAYLVQALTGRHAGHRQRLARGVLESEEERAAGDAGAEQEEQEGKEEGAESPAPDVGGILAHPAPEGWVPCAEDVKIRPGLYFVPDSSPSAALMPPHPRPDGLLTPEAAKAAGIDLHLYNWARMNTASREELDEMYRALVERGGRHNPMVDLCRTIAKVFSYQLSFNTNVNVTAIHRAFAGATRADGGLAFPCLKVEDVQRWLDSWNRTAPALAQALPPPPNEQPPPTLERLAAPREESLHDKRHELIEKLIQQEYDAQKDLRAPDGARLDFVVVDYGCAEGALLRRIAPPRLKAPLVAADAPPPPPARKWRFVGVDADGFRLEHARGKLPRRVKLHAANLLWPPPEAVPERVDVLVLTEVLEHFDAGERQDLLRVILTIYKPKFLIVTAPNIEANAEMGIPAGELRHKDHKIEYIKATLERELCRAVGGCDDAHLNGMTWHSLTWDRTKAEPTLVWSARLDYEWMACSGGPTSPPHPQARAALQQAFWMPEVGYTVTPATMQAGTCERAFVEGSRQLTWLGPTIAPVDWSAAHSDVLEHPLAALDYYRVRDVAAVDIEEKVMGCRAYVLALSERAAQALGRPRLTVLSRNGIDFFVPHLISEEYRERMPAFQSAIYSALMGYGAPAHTLDVVLLDVEITPWAIKANHLIDRDFARGLDALSLGRKLHGKDTTAEEAARVVLERMTKGLYGEEPRVYPLHYLLGARVHKARGRVGPVEMQTVSSSGRESTTTHYGNGTVQIEVVHNGLAGHRAQGEQRLQALLGASPGPCAVPAPFYFPSALRSLPLFDRLSRGHAFTSADAYEKLLAQRSVECFWDEAQRLGWEGVVVKPSLGWLNLTDPQGRKVCSALKARTPEYLRIIYGPRYRESGLLDKLRRRRTGEKRRMSVVQQALAARMLDAFVQQNTAAALSTAAAFLGVDKHSFEMLDRTL